MAKDQADGLVYDAGFLWIKYVDLFCFHTVARMEFKRLSALVNPPPWPRLPRIASPLSVGCASMHDHLGASHSAQL